jgi:hypothetical protein
MRKKQEMAAHFTEDSLALIALNRDSLNRQFNSAYQVRTSIKVSLMPQSSATFVGSSSKGPLSADLISEGVAYTHGIGAPAPLPPNHNNLRRDLAATDIRLDII